LDFVETDEPKHIRQELSHIRDKIKNDPYLKSIPSVAKSLKHFHATDDCPEVRQEVYRCISALDFKAQFVIARKIEGVLRSTIVTKINFMTTLYRNFSRMFYIRQKIIISIFQKEDPAPAGAARKAIERAKDNFEKKFLIKLDQMLISNLRFQQASRACRYRLYELGYS